MSRRRPYCWCRLGIACQKVGKGKNNPRREGKIFGEKKEPSSPFTNDIGLSDVVMGEVLLGPLLFRHPALLRCHLFDHHWNCVRS